MNYSEIIKRLKSMSNPEAVKGMARFGISTKKAFGISIPDLRRIAREIGKDHSLAQELWESGIRETRILASLIDHPKEVSEEQLERWVKDFDCWDVCDQTCMNLFRYTRFAYQKADEWSNRDEEFVKRAGFVMMATLAVSDKKAADEEFEIFFPIIKREANDDRTYVKKAVNWALRQIGKRNISLNKRAIEVAEDIGKIDSRAAKWIASDAISEFRSEKIQERLQKRSSD
ncbi:MAG: DNA alkylation repair protein [Halobacteriota archaeon]|nr:DNA alkylation repair protein [Halobacteriota archaeon]